MMGLDRIYEDLCVMDERNPLFSDIYDLSDEDDVRQLKEDRVRDCFCDNCFYGRTLLALEILRLRKDKK